MLHVLEISDEVRPTIWSLQIFFAFNDRKNNQFLKKSILIIFKICFARTACNDLVSHTVNCCKILI